MGADIDPAPAETLATDLAGGHGLAQQRRQLEGAWLAIAEQSRMEHGDTAVGEAGLALDRVAHPTLVESEVTARVVSGIVHQHQVGQAIQGPSQTIEIEVGPDVAVDHQERLVAQQR
ncbi:hypothetical protein D3C84_905270 [compost metagenome]